MPTRIPNFLNNQQSPLGAAFANLYQSLASRPTEAQQQNDADSAVLNHWKMLGMQGLGGQLTNGFPADAPAPVSTGAPAVSPTAPSTSPIAAMMSKLAPASAPSAPAPAMPSEGPSPISQAFANTAPQPEAPAPKKPAIDYGEYARNALFAGQDPEKAGGYLLLGDANTYGARDPRTTNASVGAGKPYSGTAESFDINQSNDLRKSDSTNTTSRENNADTIKGENTRAAAQRGTQVEIAGMHEAGEDRRNKFTGGAANTKQQAADAARLSTADIVLGKVDDALGKVNGWSTGVPGHYLQGVPTTGAYSLARDIDTVKANLGFDTLAAMRAASPTGGALGAVSDYENKMLQSTVAALDLGLPEEELKTNLTQVRKHYENVKSLIQGKSVDSNAPSPVAPPTGAEEHWVRGADGKLMRAQ